MAGLADAVTQSLGLADADFELLLTGDLEIAELNLSFLGLTGPTNVLSFEDEDGESLGSVAISVDAVEREAVLYGQNPLEHFARLLAHGLLHLSGMEHGDEMYELTERAVDVVIGG
jgi:probable rRNA maturation factor